MKPARLIPPLALSLAALVAAATSAWAFQTPDTPDPAARELKQLQGTWVIAQVQFAGRSESKKNAQDLKCIVNGNRVTHVGHNQAETSYLFTLDPSKTPHHIDQTSDDGKTFHGIYRLSRNSFVVCFPTDPGAPRPREFVAKAGDGHVLRFYRRATNPSASPRRNPNR